MQHLTRCSNSPVDPTPHHPLPCEQNPKVLKLLHLGQAFIPHPELAIHRFPTENHGLRFRGVSSCLLMLSSQCRTFKPGLPLLMIYGDRQQKASNQRQISACLCERWLVTYELLQDAIQQLCNAHWIAG